jgi:hypothetical protein
MSLREELISLGLTLPEDFSLDELTSRLTNAPCRNTATLVGLSTVLFYLAERGHNPKVKDIWDALVYCSTCLSVGYADIFAKTPVGKILGSALMTIGPAMAAKTLDGPAQPTTTTQVEILDTLRKILARLEERPLT